MSSRQSLRGLAPNNDYDDQDLTTPRRQTGWNLLLWFVILTALAWVVLYVIRPNFVRRTNALGVVLDEIDQTKLIISSIIFAVIVLAILYLLNVIKR